MRLIYERNTKEGRGMVTRATRLGGFVTDRRPDPDVQVQALAEDHVGTYILPFPCEHTGSGWRNMRTKEPVQATIIGWREFRVGIKEGSSPAQ